MSPHSLRFAPVPGGHGGDDFFWLLDEVEDAAIIRDFSDRIVFWNKGAERLYGWTARQVLGKNIYEVLVQQDPSSGETAEILSKKGEWVGEIRQYAKDRREIVVKSRWKILRSVNLQAKFVLIVNSDITQKSALEARLLQAQRLATIGKLAGSVAHDLSNVLSPMIVASRILSGKELDAETMDSVKSLQIAADYAARLIAQLLSFAKGAEEGRVSIQLGYLIKEVVTILRSACPESIEVKAPSVQELWTVSGNPTQLHQVLVNLCLNAFDAMPDGGTLAIEATNVVLEHPSGRYVCIKVSDTGRGISPDHMDKIMNPFFTTKEGAASTGLGLFSVSRIVKEHNGFVKVSSKTGKGTHFEVYLRAEEEIWSRFASR